MLYEGYGSFPRNGESNGKRGKEVETGFIESFIAIGDLEAIIHIYIYIHRF